VRAENGVKFGEQVRKRKSAEIMKAGIDDEYNTTQKQYGR
jgi:hypothetical protein